MTTLLRQIQDAATDDSVSLPTLLRKCKVLGARLGNDEFKKWVDHELNGYGDVADEELPRYRKLQVHSKGHFSGAFQSQLRNADIPIDCLPAELHDMLNYSYLRSPVASLESLVPPGATENAKEQWDPNLVAIVGQSIYERYNCMAAWKVIPRPAIIGILDTIRTKVLNFALEIEMENPSAGEAAPNTSPVPQEKVTQIFNTYVTGNVQNIAHGSTNLTQTATYNEGVQSELIELLDRVVASIREAKLPTDVSTKAEAVIGEMKASQPSSLKDKYLAFVGVVSDHMGVLGPIVGPYLPAITSLIHQATN